MPTQYRRKKEGKTDYNRRRKLIGSRELRLVIRRSNKNVILQIIKYEEEGDKVMASSTTRELLKKGWKGSKGNMPAAYLSGLLLAKKAEKKNIKKAILDVGLRVPIKGGVIYAALMGVLDGGVEVPHSEDILPKKERVEGKHIMLNTKTKFTQTNKEKIGEQFNEVKNKILKD